MDLKAAVHQLRVEKNLTGDAIEAVLVAAESLIAPDDDTVPVTKEWWDSQPEAVSYWGSKVIVTPSESNLGFRDGWLSLVYRSDEHELIYAPTRGQYRRLLAALGGAC